MAGMGVKYPITYYHMITVAVKEKLENLIRHGMKGRFAWRNH